MKSIEKRFQREQQRSPSHSSYIHFAEAVKGQRFSRPVIARGFKKLVDYDDYAVSERKAIIDFLVLLSNPPEEAGFQGKNRPEAFKSKGAGKSTS
jgi:hypothetical protein